MTSALEQCNLSVRDTTALLSFVNAGLGATMLQHSALYQQIGQARFIVPSDPVTSRQLRKIKLAQGQVSPAVEAFRETLLTQGDQSRMASADVTGKAEPDAARYARSAHADWF